MVDAMIPVLNPAGVQELLDLGIHGFALSRFAGVWVGAKFVFPGERPHAADNLNLIAEQRVTFAHGAVTVGFDMMNLLQSEPRDISSLRGLLLGGSATPASVMKYYQENHGVPILTAWGSTECAPLATLTYIRGDQEDLSVDELRATDDER